MYLPCARRPRSRIARAVLAGTYSQHHNNSFSWRRHLHLLRPEALTPGDWHVRGPTRRPHEASRTLSRRVEEHRSHSLVRHLLGSRAMCAFREGPESFRRSIVRSDARSFARIPTKSNVPDANWHASTNPDGFTSSFDGRSDVDVRTDCCNFA